MSEYNAGDRIEWQQDEATRSGEVWSEAPYLFGGQAYWVLPEHETRAVYVWREKKTSYRKAGYVSSHDVTARLLNAERVPLYGMEATGAFEWRVFLTDRFGCEDEHWLGNRAEGLVAGKR